MQEPLPSNPIAFFSKWFDLARAQKEIPLPEAFCFSTVSKENQADGRMILLKDFDEKGFVFFTNFHSVKGQSLAKNPSGAMTFYWEPLHLQVRIRGSVQEVSSHEADEYFSSRPRESQLGAWASEQSQVVASMQELEARFESVKKQYEGKNVPRPPHWSGYRLAPNAIEFWEERPSRLHERVLYTFQNNSWKYVRLYP